MPRVNRKIGQLLKDVPPEEPVEVSVVLNLTQSMRTPVIQIVCTDTQQNLYACARLGLLAGTGQERVVPREQMAFLAASVQTALRELWEPKKLTGAALQIRLAELGCEIDSSLALALEQHQLRRATLMSPQEVQGILIHSVLDDSSEYVIRTCPSSHRQVFPP